MRYDLLEFYAVNKHWYNGIELHARARPSGGKWAYARPLVFEEFEDELLEPDPFLVLEPPAAQTLIDELWKCGFRPSDGTGSAGQLKATQDHLEDMRSIAFKVLEVRDVES